MAIDVSRVEGDELICFCPLHEDKNASLYINLKKNAAICFAGCYQGNIVDLIAQTERLPKVLAWRKVQTKEVFNFSKQDDTKNSNELKRVSIISDNTAAGIKWLIGDSTDYLMKRGFLRSTIRLWGIEYSPEIRHIRIPVHDKSGALFCYSYRTIDDGITPKYLHPGFDKRGGMMFAEHLIDERYDIITVVEGQLDCIWLWQNGYKNVLAFLGMPTKTQMNRVATMGSKFRLCFDNDEAGRNYTEQFTGIIERSGSKYGVVELPTGVKDVQELKPEMLRKVIRR